MTSVEIVDIVKADLDAGQLQGRNIEVPKTGSRIDGDTIFVIGWVLGRSHPAVTAEVVHDGKVLQSASIDVRRPDIAAAFPDASEAELSGFRTTVAIPNTGEIELLVRTVLQDESRVPLGVIRARQRRSDEATKSGESVQDQSSPLRRERSGALENSLFGNYWVGEVVERARRGEWRSALGGARTLLRRYPPWQSRDARSFRVVAIISTYNEGDVIESVLKHLALNGVNSYLIDNWSTDDTFERALRWRKRGLLGTERFPPYPPGEETEVFIWGDILKRKLAVSQEIKADWYIHHDSDEIRESPWPGQSLYEAVRLVDRLGYNAVDFRLFNFRPVDDGFGTGYDLKSYFTRYGEEVPKYDRVQIKCWKAGAWDVVLADGGHEVQFAGRNVFPIKFILRHYPIRGQTHGRRKVFDERKARFAEIERAAGWHLQYDRIETHDYDFVRNPASLRAFDLEQARLEVQLEARPTKRGSEEGLSCPTDYEGFLDRADANAIAGWACWTSTSEEPVDIDLWDGSRFLGSVRADQFRRDLEERRTRNGYCGFVMPSPPHLLDGRPHWIWANVAGTSSPLRKSPKVMPAARRTAAPKEGRRRD